MASKLKNEITDGFLTCAICFEPYIDPRLLPCGHIFCFQCIFNHVDKRGFRISFPCPFCNLQTQIPEGGVKDLVKCHFASNLQEAIEKGTWNHICQLCNSKTSASFKCTDCDKFMCSACRRDHDTRRSSRNHHLITVDDLKCVRPVSGPSAIYSKCPMHPEEELKFFCPIDRVPMCGECMLDHGHKCIHIREIQNEHRKKLSKTLCDIEEKVQNATTEKQNIEKSKELYEHQTCEIEKQIEQEVVELWKTIMAHVAKLKDRVKEQREEDMKALDSEIEMKELQKVMAISSKEFINHLLYVGTDTDVVSYSSQLEQQAKALFQPFNQCQPPTLTFKAGDLGSAIREKFGIIIHTDMLASPTLQSATRQVSTVPHSVSDSCQSVEFPVPRQYAKKLMETSCRTQSDQQEPSIQSLSRTALEDVVALDTDNKKVKIYRNINLTLKQEFSVSEHMQNPYRIAVTNDDELVITDSVSFSGPFSSDARSDGKLVFYNQAGKYIKAIIKPFKLPKGIAVDQSGRLVVADYGHKCVFILNKEGDVVGTIRLEDSLQKSFKNPEYVATNNNGDIFVSDLSLNSIFVFNLDGHLLYKYGSRGSSGDWQLNRPSGITVDNHGYVLICDYFNHRIHLLNPDGTLNRFIATKNGGMQSPWDLVVTKEGQVAVSHKTSNGKKIVVYGYLLQKENGSTLNSVAEIGRTLPLM